MPDYLVRRYKEGDEKEINDLFNEIFGKNRDLDQWRWKFRDDPVGSTELIVVAEAEGRIIGQFASVYLPLEFGDTIVRAAYDVDIIVHPNFRKGLKGVHRSIYDLQLKICTEQNIPFAIGGPNRYAYPIAIRFFNYKDLDSLPFLLRRLNWRLAVKTRIPWLPLPLLAHVRRVSNLYYRTTLALHSIIKRRRIEVKMVSSFDDRIDTFWEKVKGNYGIIGVRDQRHLNWRYADKPNDHYDIFIAEENGEIVGYTVLKVEKHLEEWAGFIVDLLSIETDIVSDLLISKALRYFLSEKIDYAVCMMVKKDLLYRSLLRSGFIEKEGPDMVRRVVYRIIDSEIDELFLKAPENWHYTFGDTDAV